MDTFADLFAREYPMLAGYCWNIVGDHELAADLAQEAFARLLARSVTVRDSRAYLYKIATHLAYGEFRRKRRDEPPDPPPGEHADDTSALAVRLAVANLPARYRAVVWLYYFAGLPVGEVAVVLGRNAGTVKWQLAEARARLADVLEDVHA